MNVPLREYTRQDKPREKFLRHGPSGLSDHEILAILLRTGVKGKSVLDVSHANSCAACRAKTFTTLVKRIRATSVQSAVLASIRP